MALKYDVNGAMTGALGQNRSRHRAKKDLTMSHVLKAASQVKISFVASEALALSRPCTFMERALAAN
jgi:hypothetical protein